MVLHVRIDNKSGEHVIFLNLGFVLDHGQNIESTEDRVSQLNVVIEVAVDSVHATDWVSGCDNGASSLELGDDTSL